MADLWVEVPLDPEDYAEDDDYGAAHVDAIDYVEGFTKGVATLNGDDYMDDDWSFHIGVTGERADLEEIFGAYSVADEVDGGYWQDIFE